MVILHLEEEVCIYSLISCNILFDFWPGKFNLVTCPDRFHFQENEVFDSSKGCASPSVLGVPERL